MTSPAVQLAGKLAPLFQIPLDSGAASDPREVLAHYARSALEIIPSRAAILRLLEPVGEKLVVEAAAGFLEANHPILSPLDLGEGVAGLAASRLEAVNFPWPENDGLFGPYAGFRYVIAAPIRLRGRLLGTMELIDRDYGEGPTRFGEGDEALLGLIVKAAVEAFEKAALYAELEGIALTYRRRNLELSILGKVSHAILGRSSADEILFGILTAITSGYGLGYNRAFVMLANPEERALKGEFGIGAGREEVGWLWKELPKRIKRLEDHFDSGALKEVRESSFNKLVRSLNVSLDESRSLLVRVIKQNQGFNIPDTTRLGELDRSFAAALGSSAFAALPIRGREKPLGVLIIDNFFTKKPILDNELDFLQTIANHCGLALEAARMVDELNQTMFRLEETHTRLVQAERLAAIGEVAAGVAHEIRNPLTAIGGFSRRLGKRLSMEDPGHKYVLIIEKEIARLERLAVEVLEFAATRKQERREIDLLNLVRQWRDTNEAMLLARKIKVRMEVPAILAKVDLLLFGQAITNILANAADAVGEGGEIACRGGRHGELAILEIVDNGAGMPEEVMKNALKPFYTTKAQGTGLGLALAQKALLAHNGKIELISEPGKGTTVRLILPAG